jgi:hypothetical protein
MLKAKIRLRIGLQPHQVRFDEKVARQHVPQKLVAIVRHRADTIDNNALS